MKLYFIRTVTKTAHHLNQLTDEGGSVSKRSVIIKMYQ